MSEAKRKQFGGESMDDCWSEGLNGFNKNHSSLYCPIVKDMCKREDCVFYSAEVDCEPAEYDDGDNVILDAKFGSEKYWNEYQELVKHRCLVLEILEGLHWLVGRCDDNGVSGVDGLKSLISDMADRKWSVDTYEQNTTRYVVTE